MEYYKRLLADLENKFSHYTDSFFTDDIEFDKNILLKKEHSLLVYQESCQLAEAENFSPRIATLIEIASLFHDIGRFEQILEFNTFVDCKSIDHGDLGGEVLTKTNMLADLPQKDQQIIIASTKAHNKRTLSENFDKETLLVTKAVRDADKLDIIRILLKEYAKKDIDKTVILHLEESDDISPEVIAYLERKECPNIADFKTLSDFKLAQLTWIYDLNFKYSLQEFKKRKFDEQIISHLPNTPKINSLCRKIQDYLEEKIAFK